MKEKYQKKAAEKRAKEETGELDQFMGDEDNSRDLYTEPNEPKFSKSSIEMESNNDDMYTTQEKKVVIDTAKSEELMKQINPEETEQEPKIAIPEINKQPEKVLNDPNLSLSEYTEGFVGSASDSEKVDDADFAAILNDKKDVMAEQKALIEDIRTKINPISKPVDLSTITVSKNPTFINNALQNQNTERHVSDWPLFESKQLLSMESFSGTELEKIDTRNYPNRTKYNMFLEVYKNIFNHIINIKDKSQFIQWLKAFKFFDLNHMWFLVYKTTFEKANIVPYVCENKKCNHRYVKISRIFLIWSSSEHLNQKKNLMISLITYHLLQNQNIKLKENKLLII